MCQPQHRSSISWRQWKNRSKLVPMTNSTTSTLAIISLLTITNLIALHDVHCQPEQPLLSENYFGTSLGPLLGPGQVSNGQVYVADDSTIFIRGFTFSGSVYPQTFFMGGFSEAPDGTGFIIPDEHSSTRPLGDYKQKDIVIRLPEGRTVRDLKWLSIWSRGVHVNLGHVFIPPNLTVPNALELPPLTGLAHGVRSGPISIVDAQTILVTDFWYDGEGPAGYWWVSRGARQTPQGLRLKDENNSPRPLRAYRGESFLIRLPDTKTVYDFDWFGVYCEEFQVDFGNVHLPQHIRVPPSPRMLGLTPEKKLNCEVLDDKRGYEIRWIMDGDDIVMQLVAKLQAREYMAFGLGKDDHFSAMIGADAAVAWIDESGTGHVVDYYLGSKEQCVGNRGSCPDVKHPGATNSVQLLHTAVVNGFAMVTFKRPLLGVDELYDQHIYSDGQQAIMWAIGPLNQRDEVSYHSIHSYGNRFIDFARNAVWNCPRPDESLMAQRRFQRLTVAATSSGFADKLLPPPSQPSQSSSATLTVEHENSEKENKKQTQPTKVHPNVLEFSSLQNVTNSSTSTVTTVPITISSNNLSDTEQATTIAPTMKPNNLQPWRIPQIRCPKDRTLVAQIGPVGGARGYRAITGRQGWGIAWYINGWLIPELVLKRGVTYTFLVEGGNDAHNGARRHPLYLTDSAEGGFEFKTTEERAKEHVFGGVGITANGTLLPTAEGRLCEWKITQNTNIHDIDGTYKWFEDFQRTLHMECQPGRPGVIRFTPDQKTPDTLYYQCFTHRHLGWKIRIVDDCNQITDDSQLLHSAASMIAPVKTVPPAHIKANVDSGVQSKLEPSSSMVKLQESITTSKPDAHITSPKPKRPPVSTNGNSKRVPPLPSPLPPLPNNGFVEPNGFHYDHGGSFHRNQLTLLPYTLLQGYQHHFRPSGSGAVHKPPSGGYIQQPRLHIPMYAPAQQKAIPQPNIFNQPVSGNQPSTQVMTTYLHDPSIVQTQYQHLSQTPTLIYSGPHYPMKKFGQRPPTSALKPYYNTSRRTVIQQQQQQQRPPLKQVPAPIMISRHDQHLMGGKLIPKYHHHQHNVHNLAATTLTPSKNLSLPTKRPLQGGFVPVTMDSTSNRPPVNKVKSQNVWFPSSNQSQPLVPGAKPVLKAVATSTTNNGKGNKHKGNFKKPFSGDIFRLSSMTSTTTSTEPTVTTTAAPISTTTLATVTPTITTTLPTTTTTTTASSPTTIDSTTQSQLITTTMVPSMALPDTTIRSVLVNDSSIEILTFVPMDKTIEQLGENITNLFNHSSSDGTPISKPANGGDDSKWSNFYANDVVMTSENDEQIGEESQRRLVMSTLNGFEHLSDSTANSDHKPGTVNHVIANLERQSEVIPNNTDHTILSDVLRLISFQVPSGKGGQSEYVPQPPQKTKLYWQN